MCTLFEIRGYPICKQNVFLPEQFGTALKEAFYFLLIFCQLNKNLKLTLETCVNYGSIHCGICKLGQQHPLAAFQFPQL